MHNGLNSTRSRGYRHSALLFVLFSVFAAAPLAAYAQSNAGKTGLPLPRFASLKSNKVNLRVGPGTDFKINWLYQRRGLPMEIIQEFDNWRKVRDPDGNEGWVLHSLLSGRRTVVIMPWEAGDRDKLSNLLESPERSAKLAARLEPGVVANVKSCTEQWCELQVTESGSNIEGYIEKNAVWGVYPDEFIEE